MHGLHEFLTAIALALTIEGILYALFPSGMKGMMVRAQNQSDNTLRFAGLAAAIVGVILVTAIRRA